MTDLSQTVTVKNLKKEGATRIISKEKYDANPSDYQLVGDQEETQKTEEVDVDALRARYSELSGSDADARWGAPRLTKEIAALEEGAEE